MWNRLRLGLLASLLGVSAANADSVTLGSYQHPRSPETKALNTIYLAGLKEGLIVSSVLQQERGEHPSFCIPAKLAMTLVQAEDIMLRFAKTKNAPASTPISIMLLGGMIETFPCKEQ
jgi:hypothetical protein